MTPFARVQAHLATIGYKPGWRFEAQDLGERIAIMLEPPAFHDSRRSGDHRVNEIRPTACCGDGVQVRMTRYIDGVVPSLGDSHSYICALEGRVWRLAYDLVRCMELHEAGEWFTVGGERPYDPHALPGGQQCQ